MHFTLKNPSFKKSIPDPSIRNIISLPDSAIQKSIIYAEETPFHPKKKTM